MNRWHVFLIGLAFLMTACTPPIGTATVRAFHASTDTLPLDVYVDDQRIAQNLAYQQVSGYVNVPAGNRRIRFCLAGTNNCPLDMGMVINANTRYTLASIGRQGGSGDRALKLFPMVEAMPIAGRVRLRIVHVAPEENTDPLDVYVLAGGAGTSCPATPPASGAVHSKDNMPYAGRNPAEAGTGFDPAPGTYDVCFYTNSPPAPAVGLSMQAKVEVVSGRVYSVYAMGDIANAKPLQAHTVTDQ